MLDAYFEGEEEISLNLHCLSGLIWLISHHLTSHLSLTMKPKATYTWFPGGHPSRHRPYLLSFSWVVASGTIRSYSGTKVNYTCDRLYCSWLPTPRPISISSTRLKTYWFKSSDINIGLVSLRNDIYVPEMHHELQFKVVWKKKNCMYIHPTFASGTHIWQIFCIISETCTACLTRGESRIKSGQPTDH